jgi:hypothetical protein
MSKTYRLFLLPCLTALVAACSTGNPDETGRRTLQRVAPVVVERPAVAGVDGPVGMTRVNTPASAWTGAASITRRTADVMVDQTRRGEVAMDWRTRPRAGKLKPARTLLSQGPLTLAPVAADAPAVVDRGSAPAVAQTAASPNVDVATIADTGALPPDTMGDIGPTQYLVGLNGRIRTIAKSTGVADGALDADTDVFFPAAVRGAGVTTDPRVRYDRRTNRWFVLMITIAVPNRFVVAVSDGPTISAGTVWAQYQWANTRTEAGSGAFGCLADYPSLGIDEDALYIGVNQFCGSSFSSLGFDSVSVYVLNKAALVGGALSVAQFDGVLPSRNSNGIYSPQGVDNVDSNTNAGYVIGVDNAFFGSLVLHRISSPGAAPSISAPIAIGVAPTALPVDVPHPGGTLPLDGLDDRLLQAVIRHGRLWTSQQIEVNTTGQAAATGGRNAVRWYELGGLDATPSVVQSGTVFDNTPSNPVHYWMGALMPNGQGHVALGMSTAGATTRVNTAFTGRLATDAAGAMDAPLVYSNNTAFAYNQQSAPETSQRWGDYSYTSVDPDDDMTFWTLQQYVNATDSYAVRLVRLLAPPPPAIQSVSPPSLTTGLAAASVTVTGVAAAGRGFFDPGPTFPRRLVAALGAGVSVTGITASSPTSLVLTVSTVGAAVGVRAVTVTNPDGQASTLAAAFTVTAPGPPVFGGVPADRTLFDTGSGASTGPLAFTVSDPDGTPVELTALSSDPSVVPLDRITFGGAETDVSRSVTVRSSGQYGSSTITMRATSGGQTTTASFLVTVSPSGTATPPQRFAVAVVRNRVTFTWQPPATAADEPVTGYRIEAGYAPGQTVAVVPTATVQAYQLFNAPDGAFVARVRAVTASGVSAPSNEVAFAVGQGGPPLAPLALLATVQGTAVSTQWTENPEGPIITGYQVRAGSAPGLTDIGVLPLPATARTFTANAPPGTYYLRVVAVNAAGASVASNEAVLVAQPGTCTIPEVPTGVVASAQPGRLTLRWNAPSRGAIPTTYIVQAGTTSGASDRFGVGLPGALTTASGIVARGPYFIRMFATNACGASGPSLETSTTIP